MATQAEKLVAKPTKKVQELGALLQQASKASKSEARTDLDYRDGSVLVITSRKGAEPDYEAIAPEEE